MIFDEYYLFSTDGTPLQPGDCCHGNDNVTNVNFGFKQFVTAVGIYANNKSFLTMDNISIMYRYLPYIAS